MKDYLNEKELSYLFKEEAALKTEVEVDFVSEYCKKLTQQNIF